MVVSLLYSATLPQRVPTLAGGSFPVTPHSSPVILAIYAVHRQGGSTFLSFIYLQVKDSVAASPSQHGLYVCHIPDENGVEQTLHTWVFPGTYSGEK